MTLTCGGCGLIVSTSNPPIYWTCTNCGHMNQTRCHLAGGAGCPSQSTPASAPT
jgi:predicted RNA-binding Zn-ribbon protein involved in translation (DUF1610 family)